jgi:WD40 repeat protein
MTIVTPQAAVAWEEFGAEIRVPVSHPAPIHVAYSLDGERLIAVIGEDLLTWADNGTLTSLGRKPIPNILPGAHFGSLPYGGETMTLARMDGTVELWDLASLQRLAQMRTGPVRCAAVSPDQQLAAVVGEDGTAKIRNNE